MILRSHQKQIHLWLIISEIPTKKRALRKRHHNYLYRSFKQQYASHGKNEIIC
jgi:hypothetical protein